MFETLVCSEFSLQQNKELLVRIVDMQCGMLYVYLQRTWRPLPVLHVEP